MAKLIKSELVEETIYKCAECDDEVETCDNCQDLIEISELFCFDNGFNHFCSKACYKQYQKVEDD